ncbi:hypothetical protein AAFF_G00207010 [Aldrovandia affinis]|uniref:Uncharacterized protein n=1 Tax=Aldrovandia affinis TaxID=143900 RepID=A0AAD7W5K7_9TELE|nr:hypothetical protein AAFF_G00207010 [Aldrovandia affinis]
MRRLAVDMRPVRHDLVVRGRNTSLSVTHRPVNVPAGAERSPGKAPLHPHRDYGLQQSSSGQRNDPHPPPSPPSLPFSFSPLEGPLCAVNH